MTLDDILSRPSLERDHLVVLATSAPGRENPSGQARPHRRDRSHVAPGRIRRGTLTGPRGAAGRTGPLPRRRSSRARGVPVSAFPMTTPATPSSTSPPSRIVVGITGASGALYATRTIGMLLDAGREVHVAVTPLGRRLLADELDMKRLDPDALSGGRGAQVVLHGDNDYGAAIASGSFVHDGMIIVPASSNTLNAIAAGLTGTLVQRAALVTLKERRRLVIAHRESPLTLIDIRSMETLTLSGAIIAPLNPGFYLLPKSIGEVVDFMAGKLLDLVGIRADVPRWKGG